MSSVNIRRMSREIATNSETAWRGLYRAGSLAAALYVMLIVIPIVLFFTAPQPPHSDGAALLQYIGSHKLVYLTELVSFVGLSLPAMIVFLALYVALEYLNKSQAAIGALIGIASETIALAYSSSPPSLHTGLLKLSSQYMAASEAQRAVLATAAEGLMALSNAVNAAGILTALGILILSLVMLKGAFWKSVGYLGVLTGASGIVCEVLRDVIGPVYFVYGILLPVWFIAVGWKLYQLGQVTRENTTSRSIVTSG